MKISVQTVLDLLHSIMHPLSPELVHHLQRTGLICWYLGNRAGFDSAAINNAWLAGMLHNIGALSKVHPFSGLGLHAEYNAKYLASGASGR